MDVYELYNSTLRSNGLSLTKHRKSVFALLYSARQPLSLQQLIEALPHMDPVTVYRIVDVFDRVGIVKQVWFGLKGRYELSDAFESHHHHFVCESCYKSIDIESSQIERALESAARRHGFELENHHVELTGKCAACKKEARI